MAVISSLLLSALGALAATTAIDAQDGKDADSGDEFITSAWADPAVCNRNTARRVTVSDVTEGRPIRDGTCVAIEGYWRRRAIYASKADADGKGADFGKGATWRRVGLYGKFEMLEAAPEKAQPYLLVGVLSRCRTLAAGATMIMGYCHFSDGPILLLSQAIEDKQGGLRMPGDV
jgi:hypothetical protein